MVQFPVTFRGHCAPLFSAAVVVSNQQPGDNGFDGTLNVAGQAQSSLWPGLWPSLWPGLGPSL